MCSMDLHEPAPESDVCTDEQWAALVEQAREQTDLSAWSRFAHLFTLDPADLGPQAASGPADEELLRRMRDCEALVTQLLAEQSRYLLELRRRRLMEQAAAHPHEEACPSACCDDDGWVALEVGQELALSEGQVNARIDTARRLARHAAVARAMERGLLQSWTATKLLEHLETLAPHVSAARLAAIEQATLAWLLERPRTVAQLNARMRRLLLQVREEGPEGDRSDPPPGVQDRGVSIRPAPAAAGMAELVALLPEADALVLAAALGALAASPVAAEDVRSAPQRRADLLVTLVTGRVARWGLDADLELAVRGSADVQVRLDVTVPMDALRDPGASDAGDVPGYGAVCAGSIRDLSEGAASTAARPLVYDAATGHLVGFGSRPVPLQWLASVPPSRGYAHSPTLDTALRLRDGTCRAPGCTRPARRCDCDHLVPYPRGETSLANSCCLCRRHHRLKTHAPGWVVQQHDDGTLTWSTPTGRTLPTDPADYRPLASPSPASPPEPDPSDDEPPF